MKIIGVFPVSGRGHVIMTDEVFSSEVWTRLRHCKRLTVIDQGRALDFAISRG